MEGHDNLQEVRGTSIPEGKGARTTEVEILGQVDKNEEQRTSLFTALLMQLPVGEPHVDS